MLRHRPDEFGLNVDEYGFAPLDEVVEAVQQRYSEVTEEDVRGLVEDSRQRRFEIQEGKIRALYAHSFFVEMDGEPMDPPERMYMASETDAASRTKEDGIRPVDRFYLHLSKSREVAEERASQMDSPCIVEILAQQARAEGIEFYERGEVVLTREIPPQFVGEIIAVERAPGEARPRRSEGGEEDEAPRSRGERPRRSREERSSRPREDRPRRSREEAHSSPPPSPPPATPKSSEPQPVTYGRRPRRVTGNSRR